MTLLHIKGNIWAAEKFYRRHIQFPLLEKTYTFDSVNAIGKFKCKSILGAEIECDIKGVVLVSFKLKTRQSVYNFNNPGLHIKSFKKLEKEAKETRSAYFENYYFEKKDCVYSQGDLPF